MQQFTRIFLRLFSVFHENLPALWSVLLQTKEMEKPLIGVTERKSTVKGFFCGFFTGELL